LQSRAERAVVTAWRWLILHSSLSGGYQLMVMAGVLAMMPLASAACAGFPNCLL
jgi:hypothetical protein